MRFETCYSTAIVLCALRPGFSYTTTPVNVLRPPLLSRNYPSLELSAGISRPLWATSVARRAIRDRPLCSTSDDNDEVVTEVEIVPIQTNDASAFVAGQSKGYRTCSLLSIALAFDTYKRRTLLSASANNFLLPSAGSIIACIAFWRLKDATENGRLHSETYKTLNLGLALYSTLTLAAYMVSFPFLGASGAAVHLYAVVISAYGWVVGCQGVNYTADVSSDKIEWNLLSQSFFNLVKNAAKTMTSNVAGLKTR